MAESLITSTAALSAYRSTQGLSATKGPSDAVETSRGADFAELMAKAASSAVEKAEKAEHVMQAGLQGGYSTQEVVQATLELESTVKMAVTFRDKFISAYQEIMRMPI
ncbi:flagellar hook-basal body complex protein FliE [Litorisediminicola beolgyonensis]|uniref:Flagellar hook-basal body complex protein FliE n=1 Tax=Litorisediminicola beolgyonensis TaxID=1173614 RepID=A0ABW3ZGE1_9RHOB